METSLGTNGGSAAHHTGRTCQLAAAVLDDAVVVDEVLVEVDEVVLLESVLELLDDSVLLELDELLLLLLFDELPRLSVL